MRNKAIIAGVFAVLTGCATTANFTQVMNGWVGKSADELVAHWGPPEASYATSDGGQVLQWSKHSVMTMGGYTVNRPVTTYQTGTANAYGTGGSATATYSGTSTTYVPTTTPAYNIPMSCAVRMVVGPDHVIKSWNAQGNNCRSSK